MNRRVALPSIKASSDMHQDFDAIRVFSPKRKVVHSPTPQGPTRIDALEDKLTHAMSQQDHVMAQQTKVTEAINQQQALTAQLIHRAFKNKDDFIDNLGRLQGNKLEEKTRILLQEHIRYITAIVQKLNYDIAILSEDVKSRDQATVGTNKAVSQIEIHHVTSLHDLKSRIVRCDMSLMKHTADICYCVEDVKRLFREQQVIKEKQCEQIHRLEAEMLSMTSELERVNGVINSDLQHLKMDANKELSHLDERIKSSTSEIKITVQSHKDSTDSDREKLESRLLSTIHKATQSWNTAMGQLDKKIDDSAYMQLSKLEKLENELSKDRARLTELEFRIETKVMAQLDSSMQRQQDELMRAKNEFREGFTSVHESIDSMKTVVEGKIKLLEDRLRKEISQLRKMIVLT